MIKLANPLKLWNSQVFQHSQQTGCNHVKYVLNHNLGAYADDIRSYLASTQATAPRCLTRSYNYYYQSGALCKGMLHYDSNQTINTASVRMYSIESGTVDIYFQVEVRGGIHH